MKARRNGFASGVAVADDRCGRAGSRGTRRRDRLGAGRAFAEEVYTRLFRLTDAATSADERDVTLSSTNDQKSKQTLGSAKFTAPPAELHRTRRAPHVVDSAAGPWTVRTNGIDGSSSSTRLERRRPPNR